MIQLKQAGQEDRNRSTIEITLVQRGFPIDPRPHLPGNILAVRIRSGNFRPFTEERQDERSADRQDHCDQAVR